jgi:hypothetical protein
MLRIFLVQNSLFYLLGFCMKLALPNLCQNDEVKTSCYHIDVVQK